ncbi:MAG TPA: orotidine-5'-phosphate decarboxylase [Pyrinomonadaceae bacterium]
MNKTAREKLIVALDVPTSGEALELVNVLSGSVGMFKIGSQLFTSVGPELVKRIVDAGNRVFLDLKFHDIPNQVAGATRAAAELGVSLLTVHASGGSEMLRRAAEAVKQAGREKLTRVVAVTVLTSIDSTVLNQIGMNAIPVESVKRLAGLAESAGVDGVVASPQEVAMLRSTVGRRDFLIVTPGIRPQVANEGGQTFVEDQKRVATPASALAAGADYLVVGRPITEAKDVVAAAETIVQQMEGVV